MWFWIIAALLFLGKKNPQTANGLPEPRPMPLTPRPGMITTPIFGSFEAGTKLAIVPRGNDVTAGAQKLMQPEIQIDDRGYNY